MGTAEVNVIVNYKLMRSQMLVVNEIKGMRVQTVYYTTSNELMDICLYFINSLMKNTGKCSLDNFIWLEARSRKPNLNILRSPHANTYKVQKLFWFQSSFLAAIAKENPGYAYLRMIVLNVPVELLTFTNLNHSQTERRETVTENR